MKIIILVVFIIAIAFLAWGKKIDDGTLDCGAIVPYSIGGIAMLAAISLTVVYGLWRLFT